MDAGINNVIYMELHSGPKMANVTRGKTKVAGTIDRGSTVHSLLQDSLIVSSVVRLVAVFCVVFPPHSYLITACCHYNILDSVVQFLCGMYDEL